MFNKLDSSAFQQEANSCNIVYQKKTQPLKNGSTGTKMHPQKEMNQIGIGMLN